MKTVLKVTVLSYTLHGVKYRAISEADRADRDENYLHNTYTDTNQGQDFMNVNNNIWSNLKGPWLQNHNRIFFSAGNFDCGIHLQQLVQSV